MAHNPTKAEARKIPTPDGPGWGLLRAMAFKNKRGVRQPVTASAVADLLQDKVDMGDAFKMLQEAEGMGWFELAEGGGYVGRL